MNKYTGFTLMELMIAMVIMGILASIAYPAYMNSVQKARRTDALTVLAQDQIILERCYAQNFAYNAACAGLPSFPQTSPQGYYSINISNLTASTYTLTATAQGPQAKDTTCASFSVNQANVRTASDTSSNAQTSCWNP